MSLSFGVIQASPAVNPCAFDVECPQRGYAFDAALLACNYLRLNCTFNWYKILEYGDYNETSGTASGLIGAIHRGEFDTSVPILTPTYSRFEAVTFSNAYFRAGVILATRLPIDDIQKIDWNVLYAFQWPVWTGILITLIIICIFSIFVQLKFYSPLRLILLQFLNVALNLVTRRYKLIEKRLSYLGLIVTCWAYTLIVLTSAYTGALFSSKMTLKTKLPFRDMDTFVDCVVKGQCRLIVSTISFSALQTLLSGSDVGHQLQTALQTNRIIIADKTEIPKLILNERQSYLVWLVSKNTFNYFTANNGDCLFYTIDTPYDDTCAFAMRKNASSQVLRSLNKLGDLFSESGLEKTIESKYFSSSNSKGCALGSGLKNDIHVQLSEIIGIMDLFGFGLLAALTIFIIEIIYFKWTKGTLL